MEITQSTIPGVGTLHHCISRDGRHFGVLVDRDDKRQLVVYDAPQSEPTAVTDEPLVRIVLERDEADAFADILHSRSIPDRIAELERRLLELSGGPPGHGP